ncbi:hypothetical protein [Abiotrophia defectiva]
MIQLVKASQDRSQLVAKVLADLPEWFGLPDSTQEYIDQASDRVCFQAGEGWGFITLQETSPVWKFTAWASSRLIKAGD